MNNLWLIFSISIGKSYSTEKNVCSFYKQENRKSRKGQSYVLVYTLSREIEK